MFAGAAILECNVFNAGMFSTTPAGIGKTGSVVGDTSTAGLLHRRIQMKKRYPMPEASSS
jgi:hypothetical protein